MSNENIREEIMRRLAAVEEERDVRILFAVESGSRAWGFASPDSDYDVRFVYAHKPSWYLSIDLEKRRDVIEYPITDEIDLTGWDVRKALWLYAKSNPAFIEAELLDEPDLISKKNEKTNSVQAFDQLNRLFRNVLIEKMVKNEKIS